MSEHFALRTLRLKVERRQAGRHGPVVLTGDVAVSLLKRLEQLERMRDEIVGLRDDVAAIVNREGGRERGADKGGERG